jgi:hypothetical protein
MRSSNVGSGFSVQGSGFSVRSGFWFVALAVSVAACSASPPRAAAQATQAAASAAADCVADATLPADARTAASTFQRAVESGPLFAAEGGRAAVESCRVAVAEGATSLDYRFRGGGSLHASTDPRLESSELAARFSAAPADDPDAILKRAERASFGDQGCGIDWKEAETREASDEKGATDRIYRGDSCNCQARVRRDGGGKVVALTLRSAC